MVEDGKLKIIIAGGRDFNDYDLLKKTMDEYFHFKDIIDAEIVIVSGRARGADTLGERYARENGYKIDYHPADWDKYGKRAGYIRNTEMAKCADGLVAFWDGESKGTKMMIDIARQHGIGVRVVRYSKEGLPANNVHINILVVTDNVNGWINKICGEFKSVNKIRMGNSYRIFTELFNFDIRSTFDENSGRGNAWTCAILDKYISRDVEHRVLLPQVKLTAQRTLTYYNQMDKIRKDSL